MSSQKAMPELIKLDIPKEKMPHHIAIILDGNRRLAKRLGLDPWKGHELGIKKVEKLLEWCYQLEIRELTLYAFSMQNFNRPKAEFDFLMNIFISACKNLLNDERIIKQGVRVHFIGRVSIFPKNLQTLITQIEEKTKNNNNYILNIAMAYGGREEITDALKKIIKDVKGGNLKEENINDDTFQNYLYTKSEPDLIIRTGGEKRTSNFLPYQSIYSEWFFLEKHWPEFELEDLIDCVKEFSKRERRRGK
jgi:tritrans,polycis-undecaprenyl-diphosphate synthase [geranylgeranyl-diphosphate specific]